MTSDSSRRKTVLRYDEIRSEMVRHVMTSDSSRARGAVTVCEVTAHHRGGASTKLPPCDRARRFGASGARCSAS